MPRSDDLIAEPSHHRVHPVFTYRPNPVLQTAYYAIMGMAAVAVLIVGYVALWFWLASGIRDQVVAWTEEKARQGYGVGYDKLELSGFPFALQVEVTAPRLSAPDGARPWRWSAERVVARTMPWSPGSLEIDLSGSHRVGLTEDGAALDVDLMAGRLFAEAKFDLDGWPGRLHIEAAGLEATSGKDRHLAAVGSFDLKAARLPGADKADAKSPTFDLTVEGRNLRLPNPGKLPIERDIDYVSLKADLLGRLPGGPLATALAAWRDDGGTVRLAHLRAGQGEVSLDAAGTLALDADLQPVGETVARFRGFFQVVDRMEKFGLVRPRDATMARVVLAMLAKPQPSGPPTLSLPVQLQKRTFYTGPVALFEVAAVDWNRAPPWMAWLQQGGPPDRK